MDVHFVDELNFSCNKPVWVLKSFFFFFWNKNKPFVYNSSNFGFEDFYHQLKKKTPFCYHSIYLNWYDRVLAVDFISVFKKSNTIYCASACTRFPPAGPMEAKTKNCPVPLNKDRLFTKLTFRWTVDSIRHEQKQTTFPLPISCSYFLMTSHIAVCST